MGKRCWAIVIAIIFLIAIVKPPEDGRENTISIRKSPSSESEIVLETEKDSVVLIRDYGPSWYLVASGDWIGYVEKNEIEVSTSTGSVPMYGTKAMNSIVANIPLGYSVTIIEEYEADELCYVRFSEANVEGYVEKKYLSSSVEQEEEAIATNMEVEDIADFILEWENGPVWEYIHGGTFPEAYMAEKEGEIFYRFYNDGSLNIGPGIVVSATFNYEIFAEALTDIEGCKWTTEEVEDLFSSAKEGDVFDKLTFEEVNQYIFNEIVEEKRGYVESITKGLNVTVEQKKALIAISYQYGNNIEGLEEALAGDRSSLYVKDGDTVYYPLSAQADKIKGSVARSQATFGLFYGDEAKTIEENEKTTSTDEDFTTNLVEYKQQDEPWGSEITPWGSKFSAAGCGPTSVATLLSCYGYTYTPSDTNRLYGEGCEAGEWDTMSYAEGYRRFVEKLTGKECQWESINKDALIQQLTNSGPCMIHARINQNGRWNTSSGHYMVAVWYDESTDEVYISDVCTSSSERSGWFSITEVVDSENGIDKFMKMED